MTHTDDRRMLDVANKRAKFTNEEDRHVRGCEYCSSVFRTFVLQTEYERREWRELELQTLLTLP